MVLASIEQFNIEQSGYQKIIHHKGPKLRPCLVSSWFSLGFPTLATSQFGGRRSLRNDMAAG
jgi:hypothetical protein